MEKVCLNIQFIDDKRLRSILDSDYQEMLTCLEAQAWKAAHVLAGSIIESLLVNYLIDKEPENKALLKMTLGTIVNKCKENGIISETTKNLCDVVTEWRNQVHPGSEIRSSNRPTDKTAKIAKELVEMIVEEVDKYNRSSYGYTAYQIIKKIESDSTCSQIMKDVFENTKTKEIQKLVEFMIPERYNELLDNEIWVESSMLKNMVDCYEIALELMSDEFKRSILKEYIRLLKEESQEKILAYEEHFFKCIYLKWLDNVQDISIIINRMVSKVDKIDERPSLLYSFEGFIKYVDMSVLTSYVDSIVRVLIYDKDKCNNALLHFKKESKNCELRDDEKTTKRIVGRLKEWREAFNGKNETHRVLKIDEVIEFFEEVSVPF